MLTAKNITKRYGKREILKGIGLTIKKNSITAFLGKNGAGKTTTFKIILGVIKPDSGKILLDGEDITNIKAYKRARLGITYLPQESSIFRKLKVYENFELIVDELYRERRSEVLERIDELMEEFEIESLKNSYGYMLSGGERRKVEIVRALITSPKYLLLDEPFSGVDPLTIEDIQRIIIKLKEKEIGILISDHNVRDTLSIAEYAYIINEGEIISHGLPKKVIEDERARELFFGVNFQIEKVLKKIN